MFEIFEEREKYENLRKKYREFIEKEIISRIGEIEKRDLFPSDIIEKITSHPICLGGLCVPEKYGGKGLDEISICIVAEELGYGYAALVPFMEVSQLCASAILNYSSSEEQREKYLKMLANGKTGAFALTDEGPGSDPSTMKTSARKEGNYYIINGRKRLITFADIASFFVVFAKTNPDAISAFVVEKNDCVKLKKHFRSFGLKCHRAYEIEFYDMKIGKENLLGEEGKGLKVAFSTLGRTRISLSAGYIGLARAAYELAVDFAKKREVFGKKLYENQSIGFCLSEIATEIDAARLLTYRAAIMEEKGLEHRKETSMAKYYSADLLLKSTDACVKVLGAYGCDEGSPATRFLRDAYSWIHAQGTSEIQKLTIMREIFKQGVQ